MKDCTAARGEKTLYLIRHACVDDPDGERICLGQKLDIPLGEKGRMQAQALARALSSVRLDAVYTSPLLRARQTAQALTDAPIVLDELTELDGGEWDGLPFSEIRARYPGFFADRAKRPSPPRRRNGRGGGGARSACAANHRRWAGKDAGCRGARQPEPADPQRCAG